MPRKINYYVTKFMECVVVLSFAVLTVAVFINIVGRYAFSYSYAWSEELPIFLVLIISFAGASLGLKRNELVGVNFVTNRMSSRYALFCKILMNCIIMIFVVTMAKHGITLMNINWDVITPALRIKMAYVYMIVPIGSAIMAYFLLHSLVEDILGLIKGK